MCVLLRCLKFHKIHMVIFGVRFTYDSWTFLTYRFLLIKFLFKVKCSYFWPTCCFLLIVWNATCWKIFLSSLFIKIYAFSENMLWIAVFPNFFFMFHFVLIAEIPKEKNFLKLNTCLPALVLQDGITWVSKDFLPIFFIQGLSF